MLIKLIHLSLPVLFCLLSVICKDCDNSVGPVSPLTGEYVGTYNYEKTGTEAKQQPITWIFGPNSYQMRFDTVNGDTRLFCDNIGEYRVLDTTVILTPEVGNLNNDSCSVTENPTGRFVLVVDTASDFFLTLYQVSDSVTATLELHSVSK